MFSSMLQLPLQSTSTECHSNSWFTKSPFRSFPSSLSYKSTPNTNSPFVSRFLKRYSVGHACLCSTTNGSVSNHSPYLKEFEPELERLLALLPEHMRGELNEHPELQHLIEIVMDLGRIPLARFPSGDFVLSDNPVSFQDLQYATAQVGDFADDNRAGISRTLHRISAIRNRKDVIVGLTCRVGRAISGSANMVRDLVEDGGSLLLIGPPGVGKTTIIREIARMLADDYKKRVMIVDTSNEIGGDGDIPHAGIGDARRMQVPSANLQHKSVTLGDEEATRRGVQKTVLERKGPSTFTCGVEIISKNELRVHRSLEMTVDYLLSGRSPPFEVRKVKTRGFTLENLTVEGEPFNDVPYQKADEIIVEDFASDDERVSSYESFSGFSSNTMDNSYNNGMPICLYIYGISETSIKQAMKQLGMDSMIELTDNINEAYALLAVHSKLKKNAGIQAVAKTRGIPIYVTKTTSLMQMTKALRSIISEKAYGFKNKNKLLTEPEEERNSLEKIDALEEARLATEHTVIPKGEPVELLPRSPHIISLQMDLIKSYQLDFEEVGKGSDLRLRILPFNTGSGESEASDETINTSKKDEDSGNAPDDGNGPGTSLTMLPLLSD